MQGKCGLGTDCKFAHDPSEVRSVPNLAKTKLCPKFMAGKCSNENCTFAHGEAELVATPSFKKKVCVWHQQGKCRNGAKCGFAHDVSEIRGEAPVNKDETTATRKSFGKMTPPNQIDCDASTCAPSSSWARSESDATVKSMKSMKSATSHSQENLYRMMAGRGAAPLENQVATMGLALQELQAKLNQVENNMLRNQVGQMQHTICQLSEQCAGMEDHLKQQQQTVREASSFNVEAPPFVPVGNADAHGVAKYAGRETTNFNAEAPPFVPGPNADAHGVAKHSGREATSFNAEAPLHVPAGNLDSHSVAKPTGVKKQKSVQHAQVPKQVMTRTRSQAKKEWWQRPEIRLALGAVVVAFWMMLEFGQKR